MALKLDSRQTRQRSKLDQLSTTTDLRLDAIMNLINDELTMPLRMRSNERYANSGDVDNQRLWIDSIAVKTYDIGVADSGHGRNRTIPPINGVLPSYSGSGYMEFNATTGVVTSSGLTLAGSYTLPSMTSGQVIKIVVWINGSGQFGLEMGVPAASEALAQIPAPPSDAFALGYILMTKGATTYSVVANDNIYQFSGGGGSGGGSGASKEITQVNTFVVGNVVYYNGTTYVKAQANAANTAEAIGIVSKASASKFTLTELGYVTGLSTLTPGQVYFLSDSVAGGLTVNEPTTIGSVSKPMLIADSATSGYVLNYRGVVVGGTNARTQIPLTAVTTAQTIYTAPAGLDAGELTGWVYLDATADSKFYVSAPFAKNGAGSDWNISPSYVGDTPPTGFLMTMTSAGLIQITMNPLPTGFVSGYINYALNAPAVGATFPLAVDAGTITTGTVAAARLPVVVPGTSAGVVAAAGLPGNTTGNTVSAGYVGEQYVSTWSGQTIPVVGVILATLSSVQPGIYLAVVETDVSPGSSTRITSGIGGTATFSITKSSAGGDYVRFVDTAAAGLYITYYMRVTASGTVTFSSNSTTASTSANSRGSFSLIRIA